MSQSIHKSLSRLSLTLGRFDGLYLTDSQISRSLENIPEISLSNKDLSTLNKAAVRLMEGAIKVEKYTYLLLLLPLCNL